MQEIKNRILVSDKVSTSMLLQYPVHKPWKKLK